LQTGWFSSHVLAAIRRRVEVRFLSVFPGTGAQKLLKNASEKESDADETLDMVGEDDEISLQSHSYLGLESNSRTYLQELFGSFSSTDVDVDKIQDNGISDGEYQIYEQDSDDSYSGDDDN
ncbi:hypothetical protein CISIN_1g0209102mg, partial [Citrus sinensis]